MAIGLALLVVATLVIAATVEVASARAEVANWTAKQAAVIEQVMQEAVDASLPTSKRWLRSLRRSVPTQSLVEQVTESTGVAATTRGEPGHALADPQRVRQIMRTLLTNAKRYGRLSGAHRFRQKRRMD